MIMYSDECPRRKKNVCDGNGLIEFKDLATPEQMYNHARIFSHVIIQPGHSIGDHPHTDETEFYYVLKGFPTFNDNGTMFELKPGDCTSTTNGEVHGMINNTDEVVEIMAFIPMDK